MIKKKAQIMGMPIQMIFTLFIIAAFIVVAVFAIMKFLGIQKCTEIGLFVSDLQKEIDDVWQSQHASRGIELSLPISLTHVCFANLNSGKNIIDTGGEREEALSEIFDEIKENYDYRKQKNFFLYPLKNACDIPAHEIKHVNVSLMPNPYCFKNVNGRVKIRLVKGFNDIMVKANRE